jgi:DNA-binding NarL/FixJ family response regulator
LQASPVRHVRVLLVDQSAADAELVLNELRQAGMQVSAQRVESEDALISSLHEFGPDVVLTEHTLPELDFRATLGVVHSIRPATPLIVVVGGWLKADDNTGACVRAGAETVISKKNLAPLAAAIAAALNARSALEKLTPRQIEVMRLVARGLRTRDIAERLKLSVKTVESHRQEVMRRLDLGNMADLVRYAVRVGLVGEA